MNSIESFKMLISSKQFLNYGSAVTKMQCYIIYFFRSVIPKQSVCAFYVYLTKFKHIFICTYSYTRHPIK